MKKGFFSFFMIIMLLVEAFYGSCILVNAGTISDSETMQTMLSKEKVSENEGMLQFTAEDDEEFKGASGIKYGVEWELSKDGHLTVSGNRTEAYTAPWSNYKQYVTSATIFLDERTTTLQDLFSGCDKLKSVKFENSNLINVTSTRSMFMNCASLETIDFGKETFENVETMYCMFMGCESLKSIDLSSFYTPKLKDMGLFLYKCSSLETIDLTPIETDSLISMQSCLRDCFALKYADLSYMDLSKVEDMPTIFSFYDDYAPEDGTALENVNMEGAKLYNMDSLFFSHSNLKKVNLKNADTSKVTDMTSAFGYCDSLEEVDLRGLNLANVTEAYGLFMMSKSLKTIYLSNVDFSNVTNASHMFYGCDELEHLDVAGVKTKNLTNTSSMFADCYKLKSLDLSWLVTDYVTDMSQMFAYCESLMELDVSQLETSNVEYFTKMFYMCNSLNFLDLRSFDFRSAKETDYIISGYEECIRMLSLPAHTPEIIFATDDEMVDENGKLCEKTVGGLDRESVYYTEDYYYHECFQNGHTFTNPKFVWEGLSKATAVFKCEKEFCVVSQNHLELPAEVTKTVTPATTEKEGQILYVASVTYNDVTYTDSAVVVLEKIPSVTHQDKQEKPEEEDIQKKDITIGTVFTVSGVKYKVTKAGTVPEVAFVLAPKNKKRVTVPDVVKKDGISYKVTSIAQGAFKKNTKLQKVTIGKNVTKIGAKAFYGCKKLKKIVMKTKKLKFVGKSAVKGIHKKALLDVPNSKKKAYKKLFKKNTGFTKTMSMK